MWFSPPQFQHSIGVEEDEDEAEPDTEGKGEEEVTAFN